jgi:hypothetical protein
VTELDSSGDRGCRWVDLSRLLAHRRRASSSRGASVPRTLDRIGTQQNTTSVPTASEIPDLRC